MISMAEWPDVRSRPFAVDLLRDPRDREVMMIFTRRTDERTLIGKIFFTEEGEVNRRNIFLILFLLILLGNFDRVFK